MLIGFTYALIQNTRSKNQHYRDKKISFGSLKNWLIKQFSGIEG